MRRFHAASSGTLVATASLAREMEGRGFRRVVRWSRGVDLDRFRPDPPGQQPREAWAGRPRPVFLYAGRLAVEKNVEAFLRLDLPGSKVVVGDGPQRAALPARFPAAHFTGYRDNYVLAASYAGADCFVFLAHRHLRAGAAGGAGLRHAGGSLPGDRAAGGRGRRAGAVGALDEDLRAACLAALGADRAACRRHAERWSWAACAERFREALVPLAPSPRQAAHQTSPAVAD